jgi:hypothetical protein
LLALALRTGAERPRGCGAGKRDELAARSVLASFDAYWPF